MTAWSAAFEEWMAQPLQLQAHGHGFTLIKTDERGAQSKVSLSEEDVLRLARSALLLRQKILARRSPAAGISVHSVSRVTQIRLTVDLHQSEILLGLVDRRGVEVTFSIAPELAKPLAERLPTRIAQIAKAKPTRQ